MTGVQTCALPICFPVTIICWKLGRSDFQRSAGGASSYVASYVNSLSSAPQLYRSCRAFKPRSRASIGFFEKGCDFVEDEDPYAQIEQKIDSVVNGRVYNFNGVSVRSTPPMSYVRSLLPRFSSACNDDSSSIARILLAAYRDWETDRKSTRLNSSHRSLARMPSSA